MWILVVGGAAVLERPDGGMSTLGELGCRVRSVDLWDNLEAHDFNADPPSVILVEAIDQIEAGRAAVMRLRAVPALAEVPALIAVTVNATQRRESASGLMKSKYPDPATFTRYA